MKFKGMSVRRIANEGGDYALKRKIRTESLNYQTNSGQFIYSNGKGYRTPNYDRLYSRKYILRGIE